MQVPIITHHIVQPFLQVFFIVCFLSAVQAALRTAAAAERFNDVTGTSMMSGTMTQKSTNGHVEVQLSTLHQQRGVVARWPYMAHFSL